MGSRTAKRKIAKNGNSRVVTVTEQVADLKMDSGQEVMVAVAPYSEEMEATFTVLDALITKEMGLLPMKFIGPESPLYAKVSESSEDPEQADIEAAEDLESLLIGVTHNLLAFIRNRIKDNPALLYKDGSGLIVRSFLPHTNRIYTPDRMLEHNSLLLDFIEGLIRSSSLRESPLHITAELYRAVYDVLGVYEDVLSAPAGSRKTIVAEQNKDYQDRLEAMGKMKDRYLGVYVLIKDSDGVEVSAGVPGVIGIISNNNQGAESFIRRHLEKDLSDRDPDTRLEHTVLGPMSVDEAEEFHHYLKACMKVQHMNESSTDVLDWAKRLFGEYMESQKNDRG